MRDLRVVLSDVMYFSSSVDRLKEFTRLCMDIRNKSLYTAPEDMLRHWKEVQDLVDKFFDKDYDTLTIWEKKLIDIWTDKKE